MFKYKIKDWEGRYGLPLVASTVMAIIAANVAHVLLDNLIIAAFLATWSDTITFYGIVAYRDLKLREKRDGELKITGFLKVFRDMLAEFGAAEYLDTFIIRPFWLSIIPTLISNYSLAILLGSLVANVTYFVPTIFSYEARKRIFRD